MFERYTVAYCGRFQSVDGVYSDKREILLFFLWRANRSYDCIACFQSEQFCLCAGYVYVVGRREVVVVGRAKKAIAFVYNFQNSRTHYYIVELESLGYCLVTLLRSSLWYDVCLCGDCLCRRYFFFYVGLGCNDCLLHWFWSLYVVVHFAVIVLECLYVVEYRRRCRGLNNGFFFLFCLLLCGGAFGGFVFAVFGSIVMFCFWFLFGFGFFTFGCSRLVVFFCYGSGSLFFGYQGSFYPCSFGLGCLLYGF